MSGDTLGAHGEADHACWQGCDGFQPAELDPAEEELVNRLYDHALTLSEEGMRLGWSRPAADFLRLHLSETWPGGTVVSTSRMISRTALRSAAVDLVEMELLLMVNQIRAEGRL